MGSETVKVFGFCNPVVMLSLQKLEAALPGGNGGRLSMCKACTASLCNTTIAKTGTTAWFFVLFLDESNSYLLWWVEFVSYLMSQIVYCSRNRNGKATS